MRFISVRDLRSKMSSLWKLLPKEKELVVTRNGRPIAVLTAVSDDRLEESLSAIRRARAIEAVARLQQDSAAKGKSAMKPAETDAEIKHVRKRRTRLRAR